jgi:hypothetical protein
LLRRLRVLGGLVAGGRVVVDLSGVTLVTPVAIDALTRARRTCLGIGVPLVLRDPGPECETFLAQASEPFTVEQHLAPPDETFGH